MKELEQQVQFLGVRKEAKNKGSDDGAASSDHAAPFSEFFTFPQYSTTGGGSSPGGAGESQPGVADVEVTMVESHANLKIRSKRRPRQLLKVVSGLQSMRLTILHLNVTTEEEIVLYSLSVKVKNNNNKNKSTQNKKFALSQKASFHKYFNINNLKILIKNSFVTVSNKLFRRVSILLNAFPFYYFLLLKLAWVLEKLIELLN